MQL
ncbi:unnamed protein product [Larinioides sclopetarius]|jgi:hypothetical protein